MSERMHAELLISKAYVKLSAIPKDGSQASVSLASIGCCVENGPPPVLPDNQLEVLRQNTLGYLDRNNLKRIKELGGRPKRGLLLTGPPGNGKTSACRWLWEECQRHGNIVGDRERNGVYDKLAGVIGAT